MEKTEFFTKGNVVEIDELGRIKVPKEIRQILDIRAKDKFEVTEEQNIIILKKVTEEIDKTFNTRVIDELYRIVIPTTLRTKLNYKCGDKGKIEIIDGTITIKKV